MILITKLSKSVESILRRAEDSFYDPRILKGKGSS